MKHDCTRDGHVPGKPRRLDSLPAYQMRCCFCEARGKLAMVVPPDHVPDGYSKACTRSEEKAEEEAIKNWFVAIAKERIAA